MNTKEMSASKVKLFLECPLKYKYKYIDKVEDEGNVYMSYGTAIHAALAFNFRQKITSKKDLGTQEVIDQFVKELENEFSKLPKTAMGNGNSGADELTRDTLRQTGINAIQSYMQSIAPTIQPKFVEHYSKVQLKTIPVTLVLIWDLVTEDDVIIDFKTVGKDWRREYSETKLKTHIQKLTYSAGFRKLFGKIERRFEFHVLPRHEPKPTIIQTISQESEVLDNLRLFNSIAAIIDTGIYLPNLASCSGCNFEKNCNKLPVRIS